MTLILSAFSGEIATYINILHEKKKSGISPWPDFDIYYTSGLTAKGEPVVAAVTGIGKLNSYIATLELIKRCRPDRVIFAGISGAVDPELEIGDIVLSDSILQYDIVYLSEKFLSGRNPGPMGSLIRTDSDLTAEIGRAVENLLKKEDFQRAFAVGCTGSADINMTSELQRKYAGVFTDREVLAVDMEGFSSAAAALIGHVPFAQIRIISDKIGAAEPDTANSRERMRKASGVLASILGELLF